MHRVVALVRPPQSPFELGCAVEVFGRPHPDVPTRYAFELCTEHPGPVATSAGYTMDVAAGLAALDRADTVLVPGWPPGEQAASPAVRHALTRAHARGARLVSICSGVFALAHAGLLDGRRAAVHTARAAELTTRYPAVRADPQVLYADHGDGATSGGAGAGIDLCLHLVRSDHGAGYAAQVARHLVMPPHREAGQVPYAAPPHPRQIDGTLAPLLEWAAQRLAEPLSVDDLAARAGLSPRTLARRFTDQLGTSPGHWLLTQRIAAARELLETTDLPLEAVAHRTGLSSATNLRRRFRTTLDTTPGAYRRAFRSAVG
ncbi:helix-turn-helix domain-containing protein [Streptomyces sp. HSW2009]|uniref:GlxA family transcriptional regulator n=1 Tax=Streptomyces sp. HSW2009 TaxID=3142890 RepID=UPI0032EF4E8A